MIKPTVKRNLMLDFVQDDFALPEKVDEGRVFKLNSSPIKNGNIIYLITREHRLEDNWGFLYAQELSLEFKRELKVVIFLDKRTYSKAQYSFMLDGIEFLKKNLRENSIDFEVIENDLQNSLKKAGAVVSDFNPVNSLAKFIQAVDYAFFEVDSHNIIPARFISDKQEFSAATLRRKVYINIPRFLTQYPSGFKVSENNAYSVLKDFIENKLDYYDELKNDPNKNVTSRLSPYMHFGQISSQRLALEILKSKASRINKEAFLEELIVRKELSDNFCLHNKNFKSIEGIHAWAKETLNIHRSDMRTYVYDLKSFETAKTHDELWNAAQKHLLKEGFIHGYLRMYWAKKILEWSSAPEEAIKTAIYLNDKYSLDGLDSNGYVGILWSIGGLHDRPFGNRMVTGKIRYMSLDGCRKKFDVDSYIRSAIN